MTSSSPPAVAEQLALQQRQGGAEEGEGAALPHSSLKGSELTVYFDRFASTSSTSWYTLVVSSTT